MVERALSPILDDPIATFLPGASVTERQLRQRLIKGREIATSRVVHARSADARALLWMLIETVTAWLYTAAPDDVLRDIANHCVRLLGCADFAERMERGE